MRVTDNQIYNNVLFSMKRVMGDYYQAHEKVTTGKNVNRPSDDPEASGRIMRYRDQIASMDRYEENIGDAKAFVNQMEVALNGASGLVVVAKERALSAANASITPGQRLIMADEISALRDQLVSQANAQLDNQYLFGGYDISAQPFDTGGVYQGDSGTIQVRINESTTMIKNIPGDEIFGTAGGGVDVFQVLSDLESALRNNDMNRIQTSIADLDTSFDQVNSKRASTGFRVNQLENASSSMENLKFELTSLISDEEDVDLAEAYTNFSKQEIMLQSVMASSSMLLQTNLLSFLQ